LNTTNLANSTLKQTSTVASLKNSIKSTLARTMSSAVSTLKVTLRPSASRGFADHGWLYSFHTFSFASYWHPQFQGFGPLRVINEDRVEKGTGFGLHRHAEFLIFSYLVSGELEHKDSLGNLETLKRGDVQFTSAGTGIQHSEYNRNKTSDNHFLQIWAKPDTAGLKPQYITRKFPDELKQDKLVRIMESTKRLQKGDDDTGSGPHDPIPLHSDLSMDASILSPGKTVTHNLVEGEGRKLYAHLVMQGKKTPEVGGAKIKIGDVTIAEGDGAFIEGAVGSLDIESVGDKHAEFILFDMGDKQ